ncbi:Pollen receptor-like kinase 3 [Ananas comosus]|uniref:Pollen receptor-like kinase 3 n=1 Tax=Ananas comosus TaxID=4615 RepID=A0A199VX58_ANACO|nr:Pollen receptor-like kinase 3 [Ananas comosus]
MSSGGPKIHPRMAAAVSVILLSSTLLLLLSLLSDLPTAAAAPPSDAAALLLFKSSFPNADATALSAWSSSAAAGSPPCDPSSPWPGLVCFRGILTGLRLSGLGLSGSFDPAALARFPALRSISLAGNSLSGPFPAASMSRLYALKSLYLSRNSLSGPLPTSLFSSMPHLKKLYLDNNAFSGPIPASLANATRLLELRLDHNRLDGPLPTTLPPSLKQLNVSYNSLTGPPVEPSLVARFSASAFLGNPTALPSAQNATTTTTTTHDGRNNDNKVGGVVIAVLALLAVALLLAIIVARNRRRRDRVFDTLGVDTSADTAQLESAVAGSADVSNQKQLLQQRGSSTQKRSGSSRGGGGGGGGGGNAAAELTMVNEERGVFGLPDLMKASAEVLGNGGLGSAYKAVMASGLAVAVKRMRDMNRVGKEEFDAEMHRLGQLRHPNILTPLAYHYRKEEKLIVSEFIPKGSLLYLLHGDRGADHKALNWPTRLKIARGIARAMAYLHAELADLEVPHGNLKSGNVLLDADFQPAVADFGLLGLVNPAQAPLVMLAYKSPEALQHRSRVSAKSDVYCFGVVLLELLTGKFPSQYLNNTKGGTDVVQWMASAISERREAEMLDADVSQSAAAAAGGAEAAVRLMRLCAACTDASPEQRPEMREAAALVEEIADAVLTERQQAGSNEPPAAAPRTEW